MLGVMLICHRKMATYMKESVCGIVGEQQYFEAIEVLPNDGIPNIQDKILKILTNWNEINNIIVFVDMFGGTPCNSSAKFFRDYQNVNLKIDIISGVNLPMLLSTLTQRNNIDNFEMFVEKIIIESKKNIINLKSLNLF